jgi:hypothetical protein
MNHVTATKRGGEANVAAVLSAPYRWPQEKSSGGTGGLVPRAYRRGLPDYANGIVLAAQEFPVPRASAVSRIE